MKPTDIVIAPEPGQLFAGIPPGVALDQADGFGIIGLSLEIIEQFFITYGIQGIQMTQRPQPPGFIFQSFQLLPRLDALKEKKLALAPLMLVAGDHAHNDLAGGDEDSWLSILTGRGFDVTVRMQGLGADEKVQARFVEKVGRALN